MTITSKDDDMRKENILCLEVTWALKIFLEIEDF